MKSSVLAIPAVIALLFAPQAFSAEEGGAAPGPEMVGALADVGRIEIAGARTFSASDILVALHWDMEVALAADPSAPLAPYFEVLAAKVRLGLQHGGFLEPKVTATADPEKGRVLVAIEEGQRSTAGPVMVVGARAVGAAAIEAALLQPKKKVVQNAENPWLDKEEEEKPFWIPGSIPKLHPGSLPKAVGLVLEVYRREGFLLADVEAAYGSAGEGKAALVIRVRDEGPKCRLGEVRFEGSFTDDREKVLAAAGIVPGMALDAAALAAIRSRLEYLGRYYKVEVHPASGKTGTMDITLRLFQDPQAGPIDAPIREERKVLEKAFARLNRPEAWTRGFAVHAEAPGDAIGLPGGVRIGGDLLLEKDGVALEASLPGSERFPFGTLGLAVLGDRGILRSTGLGLLARFPMAEGIGCIFNFGLEAQDPESPAFDARSPMRLAVGLGMRSTSEGGPPFQIQAKASPIALEFLLFRRDDLKFKLEGSRMAVDLVEEGKPPRRVATIDRETGEVDVDYSREVGGTKFGIRSAKDLNAERVRAAEKEARDGRIAEISGGRLLLRILAAALHGIWAGGEGTAHFDDVMTPMLAAGGPVDRFLENLPSRMEAPAPGKETFEIPFDFDEKDPIRGIILAALGVARAVVLDFPPDSWPPTLVRQATALLCSPRKFRPEEIDRIFNSPSTGPLGYWAFAEALALTSMTDQKVRFARMGTLACTRRGFRRDLALLATARGPREVLDEMGKAIRGDLFESLDGPPAKSSGRIAAFFEDLRAARAAADPLESGKKLLEALWSGGFEGDLRARLEKLGGK